MLDPTFIKLAKEQYDALKERRDTISTEIARIDAAMKGLAPLISDGETAPEEPRATRTRDSSTRPAIKGLLAKNPDGLKRADILEHLGARGDKKKEASISQALTAMFKAKDIGKSADGKYIPQ